MVKGKPTRHAPENGKPTTNSLVKEKARLAGF